MSDTAVETRTIEVEPWPDLTAAEAREYLDEQIPYENFASHEELSKRALHTYISAKNKWLSDTADLRRNWRWIDWLFRGNAMRSYPNRDVHVPELLKMHRALVPRLVEAFFGNGASYFGAKGRDHIDRTRDYAITAFHEYQFEQNNFRSLMAPFCSSLAKYQVGVWKCVWETRTRKQAYHWVDKQIVDGKIVETHKRTIKDVAYFSGNRIRLCDPARTIIDTQRWDLNDLAYIGDLNHVPLHDLLNQRQIYKNLDVLLERRKNGAQIDGTSIRPEQAARAGLKTTDSGIMDVPNTSEFVEIGELWCWFNWANDGDTPDMRQTVITVADDGVVLRLQENFHDDKHLPYAVGRYSDNGFEFFDVGLYDPALRTQDEIDHFRGTMYEAADLILAPRAFTKGPAADIPNNIFDMPAGYIGKDVGDIVFQPVPNTLQSAPFIDQLTRRDMEEITGVPRLWQGSESGGAGGDTTATEVRRKIEEGNRRLLGLVKSVDDAAVALAKIMHANNQQFLTDKQKFRVLNPAMAKKLGGVEWEIKPSDLMGPVDFTFYGVRRIQQYGLRGTNLLTLMQVLGPIIMEERQMFHLPNLFKTVYSAIVGDVVDDEILRDPEDVDSLNDQLDENRMLMMGMPVPVHPMDDDQEHLQKMQDAGLVEHVLENPNAPDIAKKAVLEHMAAHDKQMRKKAAQQKAMMRQARQQAMLQGGPDEAAGGDEAPPAGGLERGKRQTNGDGTGQQVSKAGRRGPITQANNGE